jgi:hypothetical protein
MSALFELQGTASLPEIRSVANAVDGCTAVATLSFPMLPTMLLGNDKNEWSFDISNSLESLEVENEDNGLTRRNRILTIDNHFFGLTVLSAPPPSNHNVEYVNSKPK